MSNLLQVTDEELSRLREALHSYIEELNNNPNVSQESYRYWRDLEHKLSEPKSSKSKPKKNRNPDTMKNHIISSESIATLKTALGSFPLSDTVKAIFERVEATTLRETGLEPIRQGVPAKAVSGMLRQFMPIINDITINTQVGKVQFLDIECEISFNEISHELTTTFHTDQVDNFRDTAEIKLYLNTDNNVWYPIEGEITVTLTDSSEPAQFHYNK